METFKIVVDGVKLTAKQRKQIESGFERVFLEALGPKKEGQVELVQLPTLPRVKLELINGRYARLAALAHEADAGDKLTQIARAGLIEKAALEAPAAKVNPAPGG